MYHTATLWSLGEGERIGCLFRFGRGFVNHGLISSTTKVFKKPASLFNSYDALDDLRTHSRFTVQGVQERQGYFPHYGSASMAMAIIEDNYLPKPLD